MYSNDELAFNFPSIGQLRQLLQVNYSTFALQPGKYYTLLWLLILWFVFTLLYLSLPFFSLL